MLIDSCIVILSILFNSSLLHRFMQRNIIECNVFSLAVLRRLGWIYFRFFQWGEKRSFDILRAEFGWLHKLALACDKRRLSKLSIMQRWWGISCMLRASASRLLWRKKVKFDFFYIKWICCVDVSQLKVGQVRFQCWPSSFKDNVEAKGQKGCSRVRIYDRRFCCSRRVDRPTCVAR